MTESLRKEAAAYGILDTACTKTVCGELWLRDFLKLLPSGQGKPKYKSTKSSIVF